MEDRTRRLFLEMKPFILGLIDSAGGGAGPFAPSPHDLAGAHHTGTLDETQYPDALLRDGSRSLLGNLSVAAGITIDGVDVSQLASDFTAHDTASARLAHGSLGTALTAGAGLTATGTLEAGAMTLDVGAGAGLIVGSDTVALETPGTLSVSSANSSSGSHTHAISSSANPGAVASILASDANGDLTLVDLTLTGNVSVAGVISHLIPTAADTYDLGSATFTWRKGWMVDLAVAGELSAVNVSSHLIPTTTDTYDLGSSTLLWRKGWLSELDAVLFAQNTITLLGGWFIIGKGEGTVAADVGIADTSVDFGQAMTNGHFVVLRSSLAVEYMQVGTLVSGTTYNVTRNLDGSGANAWPSGAVYLILGTTGDGRIELNAYDTPRISIVRQGATYNAQTEIIRIGDLNGNWGYPAQEYGIAIGEYASGVPNMTWDDTEGLRLRIQSTTYIQLDVSGNALIAGKLQMNGASSAITIGTTPPTSATVGTGIWIDRTGLYGLASSNQQAYISAADGKLYAAAGHVVIDRTAITIDSPSGVAGTYLRWYDSALGFAPARISCFSDYHGTTYGDFAIQVYNDAGGNITLNFAQYSGGFIFSGARIITNSQGIDVGSPTLGAGSGEVYTVGDVRIGGGLYVGSTATDPPADTIIADGDIYTTALTDYSATSTVTGWSSFTTKLIAYKKIGKTVHVWFLLDGTSNATTATFTLPHSNQIGSTLEAVCRVVDNGTFQTNPGRISMVASSSTVTLHLDLTGTAFTASGNKQARGQFSYETS